jgi:ectoine hydroxylase-related dioxygenase (phytanoyl-CoA dioxygenase family)
LLREDIESYKDRGFVKLKDVLPRELLEHQSRVITEKVVELNTMDLPLEERSTYDRAFLQVMNLWLKSDEVRQLVLSRRLARIASELMRVRGVRLYHDQALYKEPAGGFTPWHADQYYWPLATDNTITAWIPLQKTPLEMGPLEFSSRSYQLSSGRNLKISDESEEQINKALSDGGFEHIVEPFDLGEVSFHAGWLFHRAGPNTTAHPRKVMTIIYMDVDMRLKEPDNENQQLDWDTWCPGATIGEVIDTPLNPVLYRAKSR